MTQEEFVEMNLDPSTARAVNKAEQILEQKDLAIDFYKSQVDKIDDCRFVAQGTFAPYTREAFTKEFGMAPEVAGYRLRDVPTLAGGIVKAVLVAMKDQKVPYIVMQVSKGYQSRERIVNLADCCHAEQGQKSFEASMDSDKVHKDTWTMTCNAPSHEDSLLLKLLTLLYMLIFKSENG